jgi:hypothetical protein
MQVLLGVGEETPSLLFSALETQAVQYWNGEWLSRVPVRIGTGGLLILRASRLLGS